MSIFYESYGATKNYATPSLSAKDVARFDREVWAPAGVQAGMKCLEIGCGTGRFLAYLDGKGVSDFIGLDHDPALAEIVPAKVKDRFRVADVWAFVDETPAAPFDRIFLFDVIEHFTPEDGHRLLVRLADMLAFHGVIVLKMPNGASPWGLQFQNGDLTHVTAYTPDSIRQLATAAGLVCKKCYPHVLGSPRRRLTDKLVQKVLGALIASPPEIWEGNFYAVLARP